MRRQTRDHMRRQTRKRMPFTRAAIAGVLVAATATAHAGGLGRPNLISARAIGWGGSFTAIADDASALHFNPAGMALQLHDSVLVGTETIVAPRSYTPLEDDGTMGAPQKAKSAPAFLPVLGYVTRLGQENVPSRFALGIGFWNTFGGALEFDKIDEGSRDIDQTSNVLLELVPGMAYEVNDVLQVGMAFRLGIGAFSATTSNRPAGTQTSEVSTFGLGVGFTTGLMFTPARGLRLGAVWRSAVTVDTKGDSQIDFGMGPRDTTATMQQQWPQQASLGVHWQAMGRLGVSAQADWTDWSRVQSILVDTPIAPNNEIADFDDSYALHAGLQVAATDRLALRGGYTFDSNAVPDRTIERTFFDQPKHAVGLGGSFAVKEWLTIDTAFEAVVGGVRKVPNNDAVYVDFPERRNRAPGDYEGQIFTFELAAQFIY